MTQWKLTTTDQARFVHHRPATTGRTGEFPGWVSDDARAAFARIGIVSPWQHQVEAANAIFSGRHTAISTGTASGKSLCYLMPIIATTRDHLLASPPPDSLRALVHSGRPHSALYLSPTKALAHDQVARCRALQLPGWWVATLDGDSDQAERRVARDIAPFVLTNPDMLHLSVLPNHARWSALLGTLRYIVIDEAHRYRGVFGAHISHVIRRLRRLCHYYGADPTIVVVSATATNAADMARALAAVDDVVLVDQATSPTPDLTVALWQPAAQPYQEAARLLAHLVEDGLQTLAFAPSRTQAELISKGANARLASTDQVASYRSGYLAEDRRRLEAALKSGELRGVASTNALELGVDIAGMDAVLCCGYPGTLSALWQQLGRAGRRSEPALGIVIARPDPLDSYLLSHPEVVFDSPVEPAIVASENPYVMARHVAAAAQELPMTRGDEQLYGPRLLEILEQLVAQRVLRKRTNGWFWPHATRAVDAIDLRSTGGKSVDVVDATTGRVLGYVDAAAADRSVHPGAIHLHQGDQWLVTNYDDKARQALARPVQVHYYTQPLTVTDVHILQTRASRPLGAADLSWGLIEISSQVTGYLRRDDKTGDVWDQSSLDLPLRQMTTQAVWWTLPAELVDALDLPAARLAGGVHGLEHTAIGLLPLFVPCDRWDVGGLSAVIHPDTGMLTVFVHDGLPGGAGIAAEGYRRALDWLMATQSQLTGCSCEEGCPRCIVSPKCGNGNKPLDKAAALLLINAMLRQG